MFKLRSERIRMHLQMSICIILICLMMLSIPFILRSYHEYRDAKHLVSEITALIAVAELSRISLGEREPMFQLLNAKNKVEYRERIQQLEKYRQSVNRQLLYTLMSLKKADLSDLEQHLNQNFKLELEQLRADFDTSQSAENKNFEQMARRLFGHWNQVHQQVKDDLIKFKADGLGNTNHYALTLLLCDLQDHASQMFVYLTTSVSLNQPISEAQYLETLRTYERSKYLWTLIGNIQPAIDRNHEFQQLHQYVEKAYLSKSFDVIQQLNYESQKNYPYSYNVEQLTTLAIDHFSGMVDLQKFILNTYLDSVYVKQQQAHHSFIISLIIVLICLFSVLFTLLYARYRIFLPLIQAREMLLELVDPKCKQDLDDNVTLLDAIERMKETLKHRDALAFHLKGIANTDVLTGVSNRAALEEYLDFIAQEPTCFQHMALIVIDIDNFKQVNDRYGHLVGDTVIQDVAQKLQKNVRSLDFVVRYGGDEFLVILENCEFSNALYIADQMRCAVNHTHDHIVDGLTVSVSAGVAVGANSWHELLAKADQSLLRVKARGKNAVEG